MWLERILSSTSAPTERIYVAQRRISHQSYLTILLFKPSVMDDNRSSFVHNVLNSWELQTLQDQDQDRISFVSDVDTGRLLSASENGGREPMEQAESANLRTVASSVTVIEPHTESDGGVHSGSSENQHSTISNRQPAKTSNNTIREKRVQRLMKTMKGHLTSVWSTEILALLAALGLLGAIFGILIHYDGIQQPQWPYSINLNTVVDLLVTVLRAMLMQIIASGRQLAAVFIKTLANTHSFDSHWSAQMVVV